MEGEYAAATFYSFMINYHGNRDIFKTGKIPSLWAESVQGLRLGGRKHAAFAWIFKECEENGIAEERKMRIRKKLFGFLELILEIRDLCL